MQGDHQATTRSLEILRDQGLSFMAQMPAIMTIIQRGDRASKRQLAEWLLERVRTTQDRGELLVSLHALAAIVATLTGEEFLSFIGFARDSYQADLSSSVGTDDLLMAIARNASTAQQPTLLRELRLLADSEPPTRRQAALTAISELEK